MSHKLFRLTSKLYNTPLLVSEKSLNAISSYLSKRNAGISLEHIVPPEGMNSVDEAVYGDVGVVSLQGPLTYKSTGFEALCGGTSYEGLLEQAQCLIEQGCKTIVMNVDTGGGEAY